MSISRIQADPSCAKFAAFRDRSSRSGGDIYTLLTESIVQEECQEIPRVLIRQRSCVGDTEEKLSALGKRVKAGRAGAEVRLTRDLISSPSHLYQML